MPDRMLIGTNPQKGMVFHYNRSDMDWVIMIMNVSPRGKLSWVWKKDIKTLAQADRARAWHDDRTMTRKEWEDWLVNPSLKYGDTFVELLTPEFRVQPSWEV